MNFKLQCFLIILWVVILLFAINKVRSQAVDLRHILVWMVADILLLLLTIFPKVMGSISKILGIENPLNMLFFFGIIIVGWIVFLQTVTISKQAENIKTLVQRVSILEYELRSKDIM